MWSAKINASTAKYEAPDEVDPVVTLVSFERDGTCRAGRYGSRFEEKDGVLSFVLFLDAIRELRTARGTISFTDQDTFSLTILDGQMVADRIGSTYLFHRRVKAMNETQP